MLMSMHEHFKESDVVCFFILYFDFMIIKLLQILFFIPALTSSRFTFYDNPFFAIAQLCEYNWINGSGLAFIYQSESRYLVDIKNYVILIIETF